MGNDNITISPLPKNYQNVITNYELKYKLCKKEKKYLNHKRKRNEDDKLNDIHKKLIKKDTASISFKFQDFSKNALSVIFSYLTFDDLLKLKNIGSRNVRNYINEIIEIKKSEGCFNLKKISSMKSNTMILDSTSISNKNYYFLNVINNNYITNSVKILYLVYNKSSNKNYYLVKIPFFHYFCSCDKDKKITKDNWSDDVLFKIKELDYFEKFQFIDELKVVFFSIHKILLYDLSDEKYKYNIIYLPFICDFVIYKKNLNLLIVPHTSCDYICFFSINKSMPKKLKKEKYKMEIIHDNNKCSNGQIIDMIDNLICYFCSCSNFVKIFDCKKMIVIDDIKFGCNIRNIELNKKHLIVYTTDNTMHFLDNKTFSHNFSFNLENNGISYISTIEPSFFDNFFLVIKKNNKILLMYIDNISSFSYVPLVNEIDLAKTKNKQFIGNMVSKEKNEDNEVIFKLRTKMICSEENDSINEYYINDYSIKI